MSYFNTTSETNPELGQYRQRAWNQDEVVMNWFDLLGSGTPSQVHQDVLQSAPLTSIRRSITNLTNEGKLVKTERKKQGAYGRPEYVWRLAGDKRQLELL